MRRFIDLNQPSGLFVKVIGFFMVLLPAVLYGVVLLWSQAEALRTLLLSMIRISLAAGVLVLIVFIVLIAVEQIQDHYFDAQYRKQRSQKVALADGYYECQYCGNRRVRGSDNTCGVCGRELTLEGKAETRG